MQGMRYAPDNLKPNEDRKDEHDEVLHEAGWRPQTRAQHGETTYGQQGDLIPSLRLKGRHFLSALFFWRQLWRCGFLRLSSDRLHFGRQAAGRLFHPQRSP